VLTGASFFLVMGLRSSVQRRGGLGGGGPGQALLGQWAGELGELVRQYHERVMVVPTSEEMFLLEPQLYGCSPERGPSRKVERYVYWSKTRSATAAFSFGLERK
jgi:hypothetical protein